MTIGEKAKEIIPDAFDEDEILPARAGFIVKQQRLAFRQGAEWMLEKTVKWLKKNAQNYYEDSAMHENCWFDDEQMIKDFQKAMGE